MASNVVRPSDAELLQAQADLWRVSLSYLTPMSLRCAVELGIPTAIHRHGGAASPADLITALSLPSAKLPFIRRLLRLLAVAGVFTVDKTTAEERYCINPVSYLLVDGIPDEVHINHTSLVLACTSTRYLEAAMGLAELFKKDVVTPPFEELASSMGRLCSKRAWRASTPISTTWQMKTWTPTTTLGLRSHCGSSGTCLRGFSR